MEITKTSFYKASTVKTFSSISKHDIYQYSFLIFEACFSKARPLGEKIWHKSLLLSRGSILRSIKRKVSYLCHFMSYLFMCDSCFFEEQCLILVFYGDLQANCIHKFLFDIVSSMQIVSDVLVSTSNSLLFNVDSLIETILLLPCQFQSLQKRGYWKPSILNWEPG